MANETMKLRRTSSDVQVGTAGSTVSVVEKAAGVFRVTEITIPSQVLVSFAGGGNVAGGLLLYTFPEGTIDLQKCAMHVYLKGTTAHENDTPEVALGTTIASGAQATLGAVAATAEDIFGPFVIAGIEDDGTEGALNLSGAAGTTANSGTGKLFVGSNTRTVHLNIADGWAPTAGSVTAAGTVWLTWTAL